MAGAPPIDTPEGMAEFIRLSEVLGTGRLPQKEFQRVAGQQMALLQPPPGAVAGTPYMELPAGVVSGRVVEVRDIVAAHARGDHVVWGGPEAGAFWATDITASPPPRSLQESLEAAGRTFSG
jgi:hypothetical protein